jgi:hypothetical protein
MRTGTAFIEMRKLKISTASKLEHEFWENYKCQMCVFSDMKQIAYQ